VIFQVINWVNRVATSATRADDRRVVISSLLRVALACKNMGNFMGVMEILSGLRQVYLLCINIYIQCCHFEVTVC
jgi:hypothetical protein